MALEACKAEIVGALGRELTKREEGIVSRRASELKRKIDLANNDPAAVTGIINDYAEEAATLANAAKRSAALNYAAYAKHKAWFETVGPKVKDDAELLFASVRGSLRRFVGAQDSAANLAQHEVNSRRFGLVADLTKANVTDYALDPKNNRIIGRALHDMRNGMDEQSATGKHGSLATKAATILERHREDLRLSLNQAGAWIGKNSDAIFRRRYDPSKVARAGGNDFGSDAARNAFTDDMMKFMDWDKAMDGEMKSASDADRRKMLSAKFDDFAAGSHLSESANSGYGVGTRNLGKKASHQRQFAFKTADDEVSFLEKYGRGGSLGEVILSELEQGGRDLALMRKFGPNPEATFNRIAQDRIEAARARGDVAGRIRLEKMYQSLKDNDWKLLTGQTGHPSDNFIARFVGAGRVWTNAMAIMNSIWTLTGDTVLKASAVAQRSGGSVSANIFNNYMKQFGGHGMSREAAMALAAEAGLRFEGITMPLDPYSGDTISAGISLWGMKFSTRFGLHNAWVNRLRVNSMVADSNHYWALRDKKFDALPQGERGALGNFGIDAKAWEVLRKQEATDIKDGQMGFTPSGILKMDLAKFKSIVGKDATEAQLTKARQQLSDQYRNLLGESADRATVSPSYANQAFLGLGRAGLQQNTTAGFLYRNALQLKGFVMNYIRNHMGRELLGYSDEYRPIHEELMRMMTGKNPTAAKGMSKLIVAGALNFYVVNALKDLALGKTPLDPFDWDSKKHGGDITETPGWNAFMKAVAKQSFGLYGEVLMGDSGKPSDSWLESVPEKFIGPEGELAGNVADAFTAYAKGMMKDGGPRQDKAFDRANQMLFSTAYHQTPGTAMFFSKWATDYYLYNELSESLNPGYRRRLKERMKKTGQTYLMGPP